MVKPHLFIHAQCGSPPDSETTQVIREWLLRKFSTLPLTLDATFTRPKDSEEESDFPTSVEVIHINELQPKSTDPGINLSDVVLDLRTYYLRDANVLDTLPSESTGEHAASAKEDCQGPSLFTTTLLPCQLLHDSWSQLVFEPAVHDSTFFTLGRLGTGKTTLCKALAQKLSIRYNAVYPRTKLVEVDCHALYSKFFSESARLVGKAFEGIRKMLGEEQETLICILIDEIESMAGSRDVNEGSNEPKDAMRAVNALLTALDSLKHYPNFIIFCTSNLVRAMDPAFLDRIDIKTYVPLPTPQTRYEILRRRYIDLAISAFTFLSFDCDETPDTLLPAYSSMLLRHVHDPSHPSTRLWAVAKQAEGFSVRSLQRLPVVSLSASGSYAEDKLSVREALGALEEVVQKGSAVVSDHQ
ncbi:hypothetical protein MMC10_010495 [Thelotrema lepadinum]|nr:hypothetical protein [Thelotrema lepadinum]